VTAPKTIRIDEVDYVRASDVPKPEPGGDRNRCVVVVDRGWIWAGDLEEEDGRIRLHRAVWVFNWRTVGFDGVLADPKSDNVTIRPVPNVVDIPVDAEVFRVPVDDEWGV